MSEVNELNAETQETILREYTSEELSQRNAELSFDRNLESTEVPIDPLKESALNKLKALGLTESEAKAVIGI